MTMPRIDELKTRELVLVIQKQIEDTQAMLDTTYDLFLQLKSRAPISYRECKGD